MAGKPGPLRLKVLFTGHRRLSVPLSFVAPLSPLFSWDAINNFPVKVMEAGQAKESVSTREHVHVSLTFGDEFCYLYMKCTDGM